MTRHTIRTADDGSITETVVEAVSAATNTDPMDLPHLYGEIDPDALDRLFHPPGADAGSTTGRVHFSVAGCEVRVHADGTVVAVPGPDGGDARAMASE